MGLTAGVDMEMVSTTYRTELPALLASGRVPEAALDTAVRRILRVKILKGLLDRPYTGPVRLDAAAAVSLAREAVARACVLVKDERGVLPLRDGGTVALIGPLADNQAELLGCWSALGRPDDVVTLLAGLTSALPKSKVVTSKGCSLTDADTRGIADAVKVARKADVVVFALGEPLLWSGENNFRSHLGLPGRQQQLFDRIAATGKPS